MPDYLTLVLKPEELKGNTRIRWETGFYEKKPAWIQYYSTDKGKTWTQGIVVFNGTTTKKETK